MRSSTPFDELPADRRADLLSAGWIAHRRAGELIRHAEDVLMAVNDD
jgi:hypothetical protein